MRPGHPHPVLGEKELSVQRQVPGSSATQTGMQTPSEVEPVGGTLIALDTDTPCEIQEEAAGEPVEPVAITIVNIDYPAGLPQEVLTDGQILCLETEDGVSAAGPEAVSTARSGPAAAGVESAPGVVEKRYTDGVEASAEQPATQQSEQPVSDQAAH